MFIAALFIITRIWKQTKCPSIEEWIRKMWYSYIVEYYTATKRDETMPFETTWVDTEDIMLSEIRQTEKD